jgi:hypothetical protein
VQEIWKEDIIQRHREFPGILRDGVKEGAYALSTLRTIEWSVTDFPVKLDSHDGHVLLF